jgi:hypothetical protein
LIDAKLRMTPREVAPRGRDLKVRERIAILVQNSPGKDRFAKEPEGDARHLLAGGEGEAGPAVASELYAAVGFGQVARECHGKEVTVGSDVREIKRPCASVEAE